MPNGAEDIEIPEDAFRVLIVDDDPDFAEGLAEVLTGQGYAAATANSARDALREQVRFRPDAALVDLRIGRDSGIDLVADLMVESPEMPCIVLTAYADVDSAVRAMSQGVRHYLRKPVSGDELLATLDECRGRVAAMRARRHAENRRQVLEAQVRRSEKLESLGVLAGGLAHDFNNLLVGILGHVGLALMDLPPGHAAREELLAVEKAALRAADLCKQMLTYSGRGRFEMRPVHVDALLAELAETLRGTVGGHVAIELLPGAALPPIEGDGMQLRQLLLSLVLNAAESIGEGPGTVQVRLECRRFDHAALNEIAFRKELPEGRYVCVEITDDGCGMDTATLSRIFDPFFTTKFTGRGMGMAAVQGIVHGHNGFITLQSTPGNGTTVLVGLPVPAGSPAPAPAAPGRGAVLIVEDDDVLRNVVRQVFEIEGYRVHSAVDGLQGFDLFRTHADTLGLVVLDLILPGMPGEELYGEMRRARPDLPVLVTSGWHPEDLSKVYAPEDHADYLPKPFNARTLLDRARRLAGWPSG